MNPSHVTHTQKLEFLNLHFKALTDLNSLEAVNRVCSLCGVTFPQESRFDRFCENCRLNNEYYRHVEWAAYS